MEDFNNNFNGGNNENELNPQMASKLKKQSPSKNFMSPTISAANKTTFPKMKILAERNQTQTLDVVEQTSLLTPSNLDPKAVNFNVLEAIDDDVEKDFVGKLCLQPYDPIKNYLSPRPKFLRYNPNRRRKIFNKDCVKSSSSSFDSDSQQESVEEVDLIDKEDDTSSCCQKESFEEVKDLIDQKGEGENEEEEEDEMIEFEEDKDKDCGLKGFLKFLIVGIVLISITQFICSMNSHTLYSHDLEAELGFKKGLNLSIEVGDPMRESGFMVGRLKELGVNDDHEELDAVETIEELGEVAIEEVELLQGLGDHQVELLQGLGDLDDEVENDEIDVIQDDDDQLQLIEILQEDEIGESEVMEIPNVEGEIEVLDQDFNQDGVIDDVETTNVLIGLVGFDLIVAVLIGVSLLVLTSFGVVHHSKWMQMKQPSSHVATTMVANENLVAEKEDIKNPEPSPSFANPVSLVENPMPEDVSKEISGVHAPTVELLGEFVFGAEVTSSSFRSNDTKSDTISASARPTAVSSGQTRSSHIETPIGDSLRNTAEKTAKKPRRKIAEVAPSPVRRSSRIQNRPATMSRESNRHHLVLTVK
ncbi:hypothetical protein L6452_07730 [Arctium lappa]|uniref:Uncharacterized protein n=1 Tax=Arctium lappa TaxID=4217 RepID=A0ACB9EMP5_ARCLA|nr:hypothetical protein L6452_07730 [Arctium lappa]